MEKTILVNKKSEKTKLFAHVIAANPNHKIKYIGTNTAASKESDLVSLKPKQHFTVKKNLIGILHREAKWSVDPNGRSTDFLPNLMLTQGCGFGCTYCYTERHYPNNYTKLYDDAYEFVSFVDSTMSYIENYRKLFNSITKKDLERYRDDRHSPHVTFDIGCDSDISLDNKITRHDNYPGHIIEIINEISNIPEAKISFATKSADLKDFIEDVKDPSCLRIRLSIIPENHRKILEMNTSKISDRLEIINKLVDAGIETHINLSPIVVTENFAQEYADLLNLINESLTQKAKDQLAYEIIFLTHSYGQYQHVEQYAPKAHHMMTNGPLKLEPKWNKKNVLSYSRDDKNRLKMIMNGLISEFTPYSYVRYMF